MAATITPNHEAQMRETYLSVTAGHRLAFKDHDGFHDDVTVPVTPTHDRAIEYCSLLVAAAIKAEAVGATHALLARVFGR